jgi:holo-[acyl-carrier protein] synthase
MTWRSAQFLNAPSGKPIVVTSGALTDFMQTHGISAQVSISDEAEYAVAFVIVEKL